MISENDRGIIAEAERECDRKLAAIWARSKKNAKFLCAIGLGLAFYYCRNLGLGTFFVVSMLPLLMGAIIEMSVAALTLRKYLRICKAILGTDEDPDDDPEKERVPEIKENPPESNVVPIFSPQKDKKAA